MFFLEKDSVFWYLGSKGRVYLLVWEPHLSYGQHSYVIEIKSSVLYLQRSRKSYGSRICLCILNVFVKHGKIVKQST